MEDAIVSKLRRELSSNAPITEAKVVYILVEIRKLIERTHQKQHYFPLDFHCSWALHAGMDRCGATRILRRFDNAYELLKEKSLGELDTILHNELRATMDMEQFRGCLEEFLTTYKLPTTAVKDDWTQFLRHYSAVIEDCPLTVNNPEQNPLNLSRFVVV